LTLERDKETGYTQMGRRLYDSETGRFMSVDPLYEAFTEHNPYHYAYNSPLIFRDPSGLAPEGEEKKESYREHEMLVIHPRPDSEMIVWGLNEEIDDGWVRIMHWETYKEANTPLCGGATRRRLSFSYERKSDIGVGLFGDGNSAGWQSGYEAPGYAGGVATGGGRGRPHQLRILATGDERNQFIDAIEAFTNAEINVDADGYITNFTPNPYSFAYFTIQFWFLELMIGKEPIDMDFEDEEVLQQYEGTALYDGGQSIGTRKLVNRTILISRDWNTIDPYVALMRKNKLFGLSCLDWILPDEYKEYNFTIEEIIFHELIGHGLDYARGFGGSNDHNAVARTNLFRALLGRPFRISYIHLNIKGTRLPKFDLKLPKWQFQPYFK
jgi:RHS repeat-associated protein